jgi:hypothetical protein
MIFVFIVEGEQQIRAHKFQIAEENKTGMSPTDCQKKTVVIWDLSAARIACACRLEFCEQCRVKVHGGKYLKQLP